MDTPSSFRFEEEGGHPAPGADLGSRADAAIIVAHPDDETLWAGGLILMIPSYRWHVVTLCRRSDPEPRPKFARAVAALGAEGVMGDLDDGPRQHPLAETLVEETVLALLPEARFELVLTHGPAGEYTRHRRHEEASQAVTKLWTAGAIRAPELWLFAYEDGGGKYLPRADAAADRTFALPESIWQAKRRIIIDVYGFAPDSFEARTAPRTEAFRIRTAPAGGPGGAFGGAPETRPAGRRAGSPRSGTPSARAKP